MTRVSLCQGVCQCRHGNSDGNIADVCVATVGVCYRIIGLTMLENVSDILLQPLRSGDRTKAVIGTMLSNLFQARKRYSHIITLIGTNIRSYRYVTQAACTGIARQITVHSNLTNIA